MAASKLKIRTWRDSSNVLRCRWNCKPEKVVPIKVLPVKSRKTVSV